MARKLVPLTAMVTKTVRYELSRSAKDNRRSLSSHVSGILTEWVYQQKQTEEKEENHGIEEKSNPEG